MSNANLKSPAEKLTTTEKKILESPFNARKRKNVNNKKMTIKNFQNMILNGDLEDCK